MVYHSQPSAVTQRLKVSYVHLIHSQTRSSVKLNETMCQGRIHAPKLPPALLGTPTATAVSTPPVGVHRCRQAAADGTE